ncbi:MAG: hypothetical protein LBB38_04745 [Puniceicoccales bacterium]|nr:hypothetical protein [Puniceicoccales bacterium]
MAVDIPSEFPALCQQLRTEMAIAVRGANNFVYGDMLLDGCQLEKKLGVGENGGASSRGVMLLHCDRRVPLEGLLRAAEIVKRCGFDAVQIAIADGDGKKF